MTPIIIIEDDEKIRNYLTALIAGSGEFDLQASFASVEEAIQYFEKGMGDTIELVFTNVQLPENGAAILLTSEQRRNILLVTKETVNNAIKYSKAKSIVVKAELINGGLAFIIKDDGEGFDINTIHRGNGLKNIKNRIEEVEGKLEVVSNRGEGANSPILLL